jgi:type III secretory pathway component EscU
MEALNERPLSIGLRWEKIYPYVIGTAATVAWFWGLGHPFPNPSENLLGAAATVASVFAGFLSAAKAVLLTIKDTAVYKALKDLGYIKDLFGYLKSGIGISVLFAVVSLFGFFLSPVEANLGFSVSAYFQAIWVFLSVAAFCSYVRVSTILFRMLDQN